MNVKDIFNKVVELSKMQEAELVRHNRSLAEQLSKNTSSNVYTNHK
jgi:enterochelin esterase-like enzyme